MWSFQCMDKPSMVCYCIPQILIRMLFFPLPECKDRFVVTVLMPLYRFDYYWLLSEFRHVISHVN